MGAGGDVEMKAQSYRMQMTGSRIRGGYRAVLVLALNILTLCFLSSTSAAEGRAPGWFRRHFGDVRWEEAVQNSRSPKDVCGFTADRLRYSAESGDVWSDPAEIWNRRSGDCEDYAAVVMDMCREAGFEAWVEVYFPRGRGEGHAVAVGPLPEGRYWVSSFGKYETVSSREEISRLMAGILWCDAGDLWSARMSYESVHGKIARQQQARLSRMAAAASSPF